MCYLIDMQIYLIITFLCLHFYVSAQNYGYLRNYKIYNFDLDDRVCPASGARKKIETNKGNKSAILIQNSARLNDHRIQWQKNIDCRFQIDAIPNDVIHTIGSVFIQSMREERNIGLFAVIQTMDLRKDPSTNQCIDYVKFKRKGSDWSKPICGKDNIGLVMFTEDNGDDTSKFGFFDTKGLIEVNIFIHRDPLMVDQKHNLKIVFTPYKSCKAPKTHECGASNKCIPFEYLGDGVVNCPFGKCSDETDCRSVYQNLVNGESPDPCDPFTADDDEEPCYDEHYKGTSTNTKVTAGAVATLLLSFVVFVLCVWVCKKYGKLCWAEDCANPPPRSQPARNIEMDNRPNESTGQSVEPAVPTAPPDDKDLPPSYDSLFPSR